MERDNHTLVPTAEWNEEKTMIPHWYVYIMGCLYVDSILVIPGNMMTVIAFFKFRMYRTTTNILICNQSVADLLVAFTSHWFILMNYYDPGIRLAMRTKLACLISLTLIMFSLTSSVCNVALMTMERFTILVMPVKTLAANRVRMALAFIGPSWIILLVVNLIPTMGFNIWKPGQQCLTYIVSPVFYSYGIFIPMLLALLVITILNFAIWRTAVRQVQRIHSAPVPDITPHGLITAKRMKMNHRLVRMQLTLVGCFYVMYMPYIVLSLIKSFPPVPSWKVNGPPEIISILHEVAKVLVGLNSAVNPVIYSFRSPHFRKAFRSMVNINVVYTASM